MAYTDIEIFKSKLDWAMPFQRTGKFPIDRTSIFDSYADALNYAKGDGSDERALGGTAYVGQLIVVNGKGSDNVTNEVGAYVISAVGSAPSLIKLAQTTASGDLAGDVATLQGQVGQLLEDVSALETLLGADDTEGLRKDIADAKTKLAGIEEGAQVNVIEHISVNGIDQSVVEGKKVALTDVASKATLDTVQGDVNTLKQTVADLQGALVYVGDSTTDPVGESGPTIEGVEEFEKGNIVTFGNKEYLYNGTTWREFGDEGSHITRGEVAETYVAKTTTVNGKALNQNITITAEDVGAYGKSEVDTKLEGYATSAQVDEKIAALDVAAISVGADETVKTVTETDGKVAVEKQKIAIEQSQVTGLSDALAGKVDVVAGKGLSTNDFTAELKAKLDGVEAGAQANYVKSVDEAEFAVDGDGKLTINKVGTDKVDGLDEAIAAAGKVKKVTVAGTEVPISEDGTVDIPKATADKYGVVKLNSTEFEYDESGVAQLKEVDATKLVVKQGDTLIINGGDAAN